MDIKVEIEEEYTESTNLHFESHDRLAVNSGSSRCDCLGTCDIKAESDVDFTTEVENGDLSEESFASLSKDCECECPGLL